MVQSVNKDSWILLSHVLDKTTPAYAGGDGFKISSSKSIAANDSCNTSYFHFPNHLGTHFDFPRHFSDSGATAERYDADYFVYDSVAIIWLNYTPGEILSLCEIEAKLSQVNHGCELLLIRSGVGLIRGQDDFYLNGPGLPLGLAESLRERFPKIRTVGIDSISVSSLKHREIGRAVHREFLCHHRPITIIEDMLLEGLESQEVASVVALPLRITDADGAPCTVIAKTVPIKMV